MSSLGGTYNTGKASVANNTTAVTGTGTLWASVAEEGDWFFAGGHIGLIDTVTDNTHLILGDRWSGDDLVAGDYVIIKMSWLRYDPAITQEKVREYLAFLDGIGFFYFVSGTEPDPGLGVDGQWALKVNDGPWKVWLKIGGAWEFQGNPVAFAWRGLWNVGTDYVVNDIVHRSGKAYIATQPSTGQAPESSPTYWDLYTEGGQQYDILVWDDGRSISAEVIMRFKAATQVQFPLNLAGSVGNAGVAPTNSAVYSLRKNGAQFGTVTFGPGQTTPTFNCPSATTLAVGDLFTLVAPSPQDATLADVTLTLIAYK